LQNRIWVGRFDDNQRTSSYSSFQLKGKKNITPDNRRFQVNPVRRTEQTKRKHIEHSLSVLKKKLSKMCNYNKSKCECMDSIGLLIYKSKIFT
jgi:hypothetical protein